MLLAWILVAAPQLAAIVVCRVYARYAEGLPQAPDLAAVEREAPRTTILRAADGTVVAEIPFQVGREAGHRFWVRFEDIPPRLVEAILAAEDARFFSHDGVDARAVLRAAWANWRAGRTVEGASTITQQLARALEPDAVGRTRTLDRKLREAILARRIERRWDKRRILETYANLVFLGANAYGVVAAARAYFSKSLAELTVAEAALVAGLAQAPGRADPYADPRAALARRNEVLDRLRRLGAIDEPTWATARAEPLRLRPPRVVYGEIAPWMTELARREVEARFPQAWARGGLVVDTTIQPLWAAGAHAAVVRGAQAVARRTGTAVPQASAYFYDLQTGYVEASVGGLDWAASRFDRATQACRQPGSAFKPIVYAAAIERDAITPGTPLRDAPITEYDPNRNVFWKPSNEGRSFRGVVLAFEALAASLNAPAVDVFEKVGPGPVIDLARRLGITSRLAEVRPLALGASCVIPAEMARAFGVFARRGQRPSPTVVVRVSRGDPERGEVLEDVASPYDPALAPARRLDRLVAQWTEPRERRVLDEVSAYLVSFMLRGAVRFGTGEPANAAGRPVAGKTGTTNEERDAWFVGYTARLAGAVWVGRDDHTPLGKEQGGAIAAVPIWVETARLLEGDRPPAPVPGDPPADVVMVRVDRETGLLAHPGAGGAVVLPFRAGTEPTRTVGAVPDVPPTLDEVYRDF